MDKFDLWRLCDELTVVQAALLILDEDPNDHPKILDQRKLDTAPGPKTIDFSKGFSNKPDSESADVSHNDQYWPPENFSPIFTALTHAILGNRLPANTYPNFDALHPTIDTSQDVFDWNKTKIMVEDLRKWLKNRGVTKGFFFSDAHPGPDYLNPNHHFYAYKLVAAIKAWEAVTSGSQFKNNGKSPKHNLEVWLYDNAKNLGLEKNGKPNKNAIENQISKVANWEEKGGAPKTPGGK